MMSKTSGIFDSSVNMVQNVGDASSQKCPGPCDGDMKKTEESITRPNDDIICTRYAPQRFNNGRTRHSSFRIFKTNRRHSSEHDDSSSHCSLDGVSREEALVILQQKHNSLKRSKRHCYSGFRHDYIDIAKFCQSSAASVGNSTTALPSSSVTSGEGATGAKALPMASVPSLDEVVRALGGPPHHRSDQTLTKKRSSPQEACGRSSHPNPPMSSPLSLPISNSPVQPTTESRDSGQKEARVTNHIGYQQRRLYSNVRAGTIERGSSERRMMTGEATGIESKTKPAENGMQLIQATDRGVADHHLHGQQQLKGIFRGGDALNISKCSSNSNCSNNSSNNSSSSSNSSASGTKQNNQSSSSSTAEVDKTLPSSVEKPTKKRKFLSIVIPKESSTLSGIRQLSAAESKKMDEALELVSSFSRLSSNDHPTPRTPGVGSTSKESLSSSLDSPRSKWFIFKRRSPHEDKKSFVEGLTSGPSSSVTPEGQQAYNSLIAQNGPLESPRKNNSDTESSYSYRQETKYKPSARTRSSLSESDRSLKSVKDYQRWGRYGRDCVGVKNNAFSSYRLRQMMNNNNCFDTVNENCTNVFQFPSDISERVDEVLESLSVDENSASTLTSDNILTSSNAADNTLTSDNEAEADNKLSLDNDLHVDSETIQISVPNTSCNDLKPRNSLLLNDNSPSAILLPHSAGSSLNYATHTVVREDLANASSVTSSAKSYGNRTPVNTNRTIKACDIRATNLHEELLQNSVSVLGTSPPSADRVMYVVASEDRAGPDGCDKMKLQISEPDELHINKSMARDKNPTVSKPLDNLNSGKALQTLKPCDQITDYSRGFVAESSNRILLKGKMGEEVPPPLPPRVPLRQSTINKPLPRRKQPLPSDPGYQDMMHMDSDFQSLSKKRSTRQLSYHPIERTRYSDQQLKVMTRTSRMNSIASTSSSSSAVSESRSGSLNCSLESNDEVFKVIDPVYSNKAELDQQPIANNLCNGSVISDGDIVHGSRYYQPGNSKDSKFSARDLGVYDRGDPFWAATLEVQTQVLPSPHTYQSFFSLGCEPNSESAENAECYEDQMESALEENVLLDDSIGLCKNFRILRNIMSSEVSDDECIEALHETSQNVQNAIKLMKLQQLLRKTQADLQQCKQALIFCSWNVDEAAAYLLAPPEKRQTPDLLRVTVY